MSGFVGGHQNNSILHQVLSVVCDSVWFVTASTAAWCVEGVCLGLKHFNWNEAILLVTWLIPPNFYYQHQRKKQKWDSDLLSAHFLQCVDDVLEFWLLFFQRFIIIIGIHKLDGKCENTLDNFNYFNDLQMQLHWWIRWNILSRVPKRHETFYSYTLFSTK